MRIHTGRELTPFKGLGPRVTVTPCESWPIHHGRWRADHPLPRDQAHGFGILWAHSPPMPRRRRSRVTYRPTDEHEELRAVVRELAEERIAPRAAEIDEKAEFPWDLKELLAKQDLLGTCFEARHGGTDLDTVGQSIVVEEV